MNLFDMVIAKAGVKSTETGGGGGTITDGIVVKAMDADGYPTEVDLFQTTGVLMSVIAGTINNQSTYFKRLEKVNLKFNLTEIQGDAFSGLSNLKTITGIKENVFEDVTGINGFYIFNNCALEGELFFPNLTSLSKNAYTFYQMPNITKLNCPKVTYAHQYFCYGCNKLKELYLPKVTKVNGNDRYALGSNPALEILQIGSIGNAISLFHNVALRGCTQDFLTITAYTTPAYKDTLLANIRNEATNATIIIKDSTTGDTIVTSTP